MTNRMSAAAAESFAGVGRSTLMRFAEAGYFSIEKDAEGAPLFMKKELCDLFSIPFEAENTDQPANDLVSDSEIDAPKKADTDEVGRTSADYATTTQRETNNIKAATDPLSEDARENVTVNANQEDEATNIEVLEPQENFDMTASAANEIDFESTRAVQELEGDILKLKRVIELQEQLLDSREAELRDLKQQREWLQRRIEKSEEKSERDQLLLISEMQMLTRLVAEQSRKRSPVVAALEWLGFKDPAPLQTGNTLDYRILKEKADSNHGKQTDQAS